MDITSLVEAIYEDLNASLTAMRWPDASALVITLECDDWTDLDRRRRFELTCADPVEVHCSLGPFSEICIFSDHPLLLEHSGPHSQLFFSSPPASPGEVYLASHAAIDSVLRGWRDPKEFLCHEPERFGEMLAGGNGLMALGPTVVIDALEQRLNAMLRVNSLPTHTKTGAYMALTIDTDFVICRSVEVSELGS